MKKNFKRLFALVLTLCLLASLMVPVAFAEDEAVAAPSANVAETYPIRLKDLDHTDPATATGLDALLTKYSSTNQAYQYNGFTFAKLATAYGNGEVNWNYVGTSNEWALRADRAYQFRLNKGWAAVQIRVENPGLYALNLTTDKNTYENWENETGAWAGDVTAYIIPLTVYEQAIVDGTTSVEGTDGTVTEVVPTAADVIPTLMIDEYCVGTDNMAAEESAVSFAQTRMDGGEYVVVFAASAANYTLSEMSLLGTPDVLENVDTYDLNPFDFTNTDPTTWAGTVNEVLLTDGAVNTGYITVGTGIDYATHGWKAFSYNGTFRGTAASMYAPSLKTSGSDWAAIVLNVTDSGMMYLSLKTDRTTPASPFSNSYGDWTGDVTAYLIPMADYTANYNTDKKTTVASLMDADHCVGTRTLYSFADTITFDRTYMEAGEYILAYNFVSDTSRYPVHEITLDKVVVDTLPGNDKLSGTVATYDFEIYNNERYAPIFTYENGTTGGRGWGNGAFSGLEGAYEAGTSVKDILAADYDAGIHNFKLETLGTITSSTFEGDLTDTDTGLRIQKKAATETAESQYMALRINVPATALYNVTLNASHYSVTTLNIYTYSADAEGDVAANMTEDNLAASFTSGKNLSFNKMLTAGDNIIVFEIDETTAKETLRLLNMELAVVDSEAVTYSFDLYNSEVYLAALTEKSGGQITALGTASSTNINKYEWTDAEGVTASISGAELIAELFVAGKMNWALDSMKVDNALKSVNHPSGSLQFRARNIDDGYTSFRILVENAGTYNITLKASCTTNPYTAYLFPATNAYTTYKSSPIDATSYMNENYLLGTSETKSAAVSTSYTFKQAGEYVLVIAETGTGNNDIYASSMVIEPVAVNYIADGAGYATFDEAVAAATESIVLLQDTTAGDVVVPAGVTLDLNGYNLDAASVEFAAAADIIDSADGKALLRSAAEITFNEDNAQLPLYDIDNNTYKLFNVEVESCATTGSGSATKYWFKVNFSNAAALDMIGQFTELRVQADMTGVIKADSGDYVAGDEWAAVAYADAAFSNSWAANSNSYIVVSAVGSNLSSFKLNPGITANGVVISGDAMTKN